MTDHVTDYTRWTSESILAFLRENRTFLRGQGVTAIGVFGSYARGDQSPDSDIDFLFRMDDMTFTRWMNVWNFLEDHLDREVDLVPEKDLRPELRSRVLREVQFLENL